MTLQRQRGTKGELIAREYLQNKGYEILQANWRFKRSEVDLICRQGKTLVFVEVKARSGKGFGLPEESVDGRKQQQLLLAAEAFIEETGHEGDIRFDIVAIDLQKNPPGIYHIEDAFFPYQE